jgi:Protein of unknown function (DUF1559).
MENRQWTAGVRIHTGGNSGGDRHHRHSYRTAGSAGGTRSHPAHRAQNNMRQVGISVMNYHETHNMLPPFGFVAPNKWWKWHTFS